PGIPAHRFEKRGVDDALRASYVSIPQPINSGTSPLPDRNMGVDVSALAVPVAEINGAVGIQANGGIGVVSARRDSVRDRKFGPRARAGIKAESAALAAAARVVPHPGGTVRRDVHVAMETAAAFGVHCAGTHGDYAGTVARAELV